MKKKNEIIYKIVKNNKIPELAVIEVSGFKNEITLGDTLNSIKHNERGIKELEAELRIKKAIMQNVLNNYPEIKKIDDKIKLACLTYYEAKRFVDIGNDKLKLFKKAQEDLIEEVENIEKQTGIKKTVISEPKELIKEVTKK